MCPVLTFMRGDSEEPERQAKLRWTLSEREALQAHIIEATQQRKQSTRNILTENAVSARVAGSGIRRGEAYS